MRAQGRASQAGKHTAAFEAIGSWGRWAEELGHVGSVAGARGLSSWGMWAQELGRVGSGAGARGLSSYSSQSLEHRLNSCGSQA